MSQMVEGPVSGTITSVLSIPDAPPPPGGWPLVIWLHGRGEAADAYRDPMVGAMVHGPLWRRHKTGWQPPCVVLCPRLLTASHRWHTQEVLRQVDSVVERLLTSSACALAQQRIAATGFSIGGLGCYALAWHRQKRQGWQIRAMLPVDTYNPPPVWNHTISPGAIDTATWSHHSASNAEALVYEALVNPNRRHQAETYEPSISHGGVGRRCYERTDGFDWLMNLG